MFFDMAERYGDAPFVWAKDDGSYRPLSWREVGERVIGLARGLRARGIETGDRVVLLSENRPEWLIADLAIMAVGAITVPAYVTNTVSDHLHILRDSGATAAIVSTRRLADGFLPAAHMSAALHTVVTIDPIAIRQQIDAEIFSMDDTVAAGRDHSYDVGHHVDQWRRDATACIMYTSGTGGSPKGVMLSHASIIHNCMGAWDALMELGLGDEVFLSFLPLSHSYEHTAGQFFPISLGAQIYYAEGVETLATNLLEARPTLMTAVPRLYETMHARFMRRIGNAGEWQRRLFLKAVDLGRTRQLQTASLGPVDRLADALLDLLVRRKVRRSFGGRLKALVSGGGPLNPDIGLFFQALGLRILQGYGLTEAGPVVAVNRPRRVKIHTVGPPLMEVEVRIAGDGEILVRGDLLMQGYWNDETASRICLRDGWLYTGDVGVMDHDGYIQITDRKKDIIVNSGGDNLSPQRVEGMLTLQPEIAQAMVYGDRRPHLVALLVPDADWLAAWARRNGKATDLAGVVGDKDLGAALRGAVNRVNEHLSTIEKVRKILIADEPFSVENEQMTPTLKVRRHKVIEVYGERLGALYG